MKCADCKKEMNKVFKDVKKLGFGVFDSERKKRVNPEKLSVILDGGSKKIRPEVQLRASLPLIEKIYKKKFGNQDPYDLKLFQKDEGLFVERLIRAVEICTLRYVLRKEEGGLNTVERYSITKGRRHFLWER